MPTYLNVVLHAMLHADTPIVRIGEVMGYPVGDIKLLALTHRTHNKVVFYTRRSVTLTKVHLESIRYLFKFFVEKSLAIAKQLYTGVRGCKFLTHKSHHSPDTVNCHG